LGLDSRVRLVGSASLSLRKSGGGLMRLQRVGLSAAAILVVCVVVPRADATILASDDFSAPGSGTGWKAGNNWEGLAGGVGTTAGGVMSFRDFAAPIDGTNQVTYIRFDFTQSVPGTGAQWGGASLFEGVEGAAGTETYFGGDPGQFPRYGLDLQSAAAGTVDSGIPINNQSHTMITEIDTTPAGAAATYRLWVDNFNINTPTATKAVAVSPIDAPWGTFRLAADTTAATVNTDLFDNLTIATTAGEVGLVPEPALLGLLGLFGMAALGMYCRRR
jgi:PEP-CTERM motif